MRILHVMPSLSVVHGGVCAAIWTTMRALRLKGIDADLITTDDDGAHRLRDIPLGRFVRQQGVNVSYFPRQTHAYTVSLPLLNWLSHHAREYDLIHAHGLFTFAPVAAAWAARMRGVPYVMCPHGTLTRWARAASSAWAKRASFRMIEGPLLAGAARVHFTSESELADAREIAPMPNGTVIPLGVEPRSDDDPVDSAGRMDAGGRWPAVAAEGRPVVLFLSRLHPVKGLDLLLTAFANVRRSCPQALLVIAGEGTPDYTSSLRQQVRELGLQKDVRWVGFVTGARKRSLLLESSVFVLPSWSENFSYAVAEAMEARLPVVVTRAVGISELVERAGAGVVVDRSPEALATAITELLRDAPSRQRMGDCGHRAVRRELSPDTFGGRLQSLYQDVLGQAPDTARASQRA